MRLTTLLALGLLLTSATKFRLHGLPVSPGIVLVVIWIVLRFLQSLAKDDLPLTPPLRIVLVFWAWLTVAEALGTLNALVIGYPRDTALFLHDVMAYPLVGAIACLSVLGADAAERMRQVAQAMVWWGTILLLPQVAAGLHLIRLPLIDPWFGNRFEGWSTNPNQLAFLCAVLVLTALHLADTAAGARERVASTAGMIVPLVIGRLTRTDTFTFALVGATVVFLFSKVRLWLSWSGRLPGLRPSLAGLVIIIAPLLLLAAAPFTMRVSNDTSHLALSLMKDGGKEAKQETDLRLALWHEAIDIGLRTSMLGLGPGPHLPIPPKIVAARETEVILNKGAGNPPVNGTPDFEAHNTFLDLFAQGGVVATVSFVWLIGGAALRTWKVHSAGLMALLTGLSFFALTNLIIREPSFWFGLVLCLLAGTGHDSRTASWTAAMGVSSGV